jgi:hypothetical protein
VTANEQIEALSKIGCIDAIQEIRRNGNRPLSPDRLNHHIEHAIKTGLVARVTGLTKISGVPLTDSQVERLTERCLQQEWFVDALSAAKLGHISTGIRRSLVEALISHKLADSRAEVLELLQEKSE